MSIPVVQSHRKMQHLFAPIVDDLAKVETIIQQKLSSSQPGVTELVAHLKHYRGKRLRPALLLLTAHACGTVTSAHHVLGAVVEMIHTATLVHDDVLDSASVRRHRPTVNAKWNNQASILLGDYLFTHAFHLSSTLDDVRACRIIGDATNRLCEGELHQIVEQGNLDLAEKAYFEIIDAKTAELTSCCCRLASLYSGTSNHVVEKLARFGRLLGLAFQIADDVLDLMGDERTAGKSLGTDLQQQKLTLPIIRLFSSSTNGEVQNVKYLLRATDDNDRQLLTTMLREKGVLEESLDQAEAFTNEARGLLDCLPDSPCREILEQLTYRVVRRNV